MIIYTYEIQEDSIFTFCFCLVNIKIINTISKRHYLEDSLIRCSGKENLVLETSGRIFYRNICLFRVLSSLT